MARPSAPDPVLGPVLRAERQNQQRSMEAVAHDAGVTTNSLMKIELGRSDPSYSTVKRIASTLGMTRTELAQRLDQADSQNLP